MILKKLKLINFRGYKNIEIDFNKDMNVIIGKNDVGKSTILEALEIFFNSEKIKIDITDLCVKPSSSNMSISCCFDVGDGKILLDSSNYTNCKDEYLLNDDGLLEIKKSWDCSKGKITTSSLKTYITACYPTKYKTPLIQEKISSLQKMYDLYKDDPVYVPEKRTKSAELRKAIYSKELSDPVNKKIIDIDLSKEDAKNIWDSISKQLPLYFLFESDRKNTDKDSEIQDPLKSVTKAVVSNMNNEIAKLQEEVKRQVEEIGSKTIKKLAELDSNIAKNIRPLVTLKPIDSSFNFDLVADDNIPLNKRGSGVRRLILLSYFRADTEEQLVSNGKRQMIYAIEEPETSQHPDYQRMIIDTLLEVSSKSTHQIIVTSHTPEIAKLVTPEQLIFIKKDNNQNPYIENNEENKIKDISDTLGILPYALTKTIIYVEGPNDVNFLTNINQNIPELKEIIDLKKSDIQIIPLQGSRSIDTINKNYFKDIPVKEIYFVDNDVQKYKKLINEIEDTNDGKRYGWHTLLPEMENYIHPNLIEKEMNISLEELKNRWSAIDVPKSLISLCMTSISDVKEREKTIKTRLNGSISKKITKFHFEDLHCWEEVETWFKKIKEINDGTYVIKKTPVI